MAVKHGYEPNLKGIASYLHNETGLSMKDVYNNLVVVPRGKAADEMSLIMIAANNDDESLDNDKTGNNSPNSNKMIDDSLQMSDKTNNDSNPNESETILQHSNSNSNSDYSDGFNFERFAVTSVMNKSINGFENKQMNTSDRLRIQTMNSLDLVSTILHRPMAWSIYDDIVALFKRIQNRSGVFPGIDHDLLEPKCKSHHLFDKMRNYLHEASENQKYSFLKDEALFYTILLDCNTTAGHPVLSVYF